MNNSRSNCNLGVFVCDLLDACKLWLTHSIAFLFIYSFLFFTQKKWHAFHCFVVMRTNANEETGKQTCLLAICVGINTLPAMEATVGHSHSGSSNGADPRSCTPHTHTRR
jgi:hypothetical protein